ncbi:MAG: hypothetical protein WBM19_13220, partial [Azonexus sp.]
GIDRPTRISHEHQLTRRSIQEAVGCLDVRMVDSPVVVFTASAKSEKRQDDQNDDDQANDVDDVVHMTSSGWVG